MAYSRVALFGDGTSFDDVGAETLYEALESVAYDLRCMAEQYGELPDALVVFDGQGELARITIGKRAADALAA